MAHVTDGPEAFRTGAGEFARGCRGRKVSRPCRALAEDVRSGSSSFLDGAGEATKATESEGRVLEQGTHPRPGWVRKPRADRSEVVRRDFTPPKANSRPLRKSRSSQRRGIRHDRTKKNHPFRRWHLPINTDNYLRGLNNGDIVHYGAIHSGADFSSPSA